MTDTALSLLFTAVQFILARVAASDATKAAFLTLVKSSMNDGLISQQTHQAFSDQFHSIEDELNANPNPSVPTP